MYVKYLKKITQMVGEEVKGIILSKILILLNGLTLILITRFVKCEKVKHTYYNFCNRHLK